MKLIIVILLFPLFLQGQSIISCDDFENGLNGWQFTYPVNHVNSWEVSTASGGSNAMFVTCDNVNFNYCNATSGTERIVVWKHFNTAQCNGDLLITYNWTGFGQSTNDYGSWGLCSGNPNIVTSWPLYTSPHSGSFTWQNASLLVGSNFAMFYNVNLKFGFIFEYNNTITGSTSFAFDNFCIKCFQSPLSIDTLQTQSIHYVHPEKHTYKYYNMIGQQIAEPTHGLYIKKDEYGHTIKQYKQ